MVYPKFEIRYQGQSAPSIKYPKRKYKQKVLKAPHLRTSSGRGTACARRMCKNYASASTGCIHSYSMDFSNGELINKHTLTASLFYLLRAFLNQLFIF